MSFSDAMLKSIEKIKELHKNAPIYTAFTPYRICPLGAHIDHQRARITGFAIDKGIYIAYTPKDDGVIEVSSVQFDGVATWRIDSVPSAPVGDWADHMRGATKMLAEITSKKYQ